MSNNPIPNELRSEHLFLLVGTNPLPNWVAVKLLLYPDGQLYLVHSKTTNKVAKRLAEYALAKGYLQPMYVPIDDPHRSDSVEAAINDKLDAIKSDSVGLNYTGGTKVMAVHSYRALARWRPGEVIFSYLEAAESLMHFDANKHYPSVYQAKVGTKNDVRFELREVFELHEGFDLQGQQIKRDIQGETLLSLLINVHITEQEQRAWRSNCFKLLRYPQPSPGQRPPRRQKPKELKNESDIWKEPLILYPQFAHIAEALISGGSQGCRTFGDIIISQNHGWQTARELIEWMDGKWLEHYVLQQIRERKDDYDVHDFGWNINPMLPFEFDADVAAMRGFQLHLISCYSGHEKPTCKTKLFEVFTRARQAGGEAARAALVCCTEEQKAIEREVGESWDIAEQVKVFGRTDLQHLGERLKDWFDKGSR